MVANVDGVTAKALLDNPTRLSMLHDDVVASGFALRRAMERRGKSMLTSWKLMADLDDVYIRQLRRDPGAVSKFGDDLIDEEGLRPFIDEHGAEGILAWKWLDEAFPTRKFCKTL